MQTEDVEQEAGVSVRLRNTRSGKPALWGPTLLPSVEADVELGRVRRHLPLLLEVDDGREKNWEGFPAKSAAYQLYIKTRVCFLICGVRTKSRNEGFRLGFSFSPPSSSGLRLWGGNRKNRLSHGATGSLVLPERQQHPRTLLAPYVTPSP